MLKTLLIRSIVWLLSSLPFRWNQWLGRQLGKVIYYTRARICRTTYRNLEHCFPEFPKDKIHQLAYRSCIESGLVATEAFWVWQRSLDDINSKIKQVEGTEHIQKALDSGESVLLTGPHFGNWELITFWCGLHFPTYAMYRSPKVKALDSIIRKGREKTGAKLISASRNNARNMLKVLREKNVFVVLSDQEPVKGSGVYAPFFGQPAYTMTLIQRLLQKSNARLLYFAIEREQGGFSVKILPGNPIDKMVSAEVFAGDLNRNLESIISSKMEQFEWGYKRFKSPPDGDYDFYEQ